MSATTRELRGLDWLNFFIADVQTGFGPFISVYLTQNRWTDGEIGAALSVGTIVSLIGQVPAGAVVDALRDKRRAVWVGVIAVMATAVLYAVSAAPTVIFAAEAVHGLVSSVLAPAIAAVTLTLVGRAAFSERIGRNARFASLGSGLTAGLLGIAGTTLAPQAVFWLTAALGVPALIALRQIGPGAAVDTSRLHSMPLPGWRSARRLLTDRRILVFSACILLFFLANAAMLPLAATIITRRHPEFADGLIAITVLLPQSIVAGISPFIGRLAERHGRRPIMLLGWFMLPLQALLYAAFFNPFTVLACQALSGISGAVFGIMLPLVAADLTHGSGRFNLTMGVLGLPIYLGAAISTTMSGYAADQFGDRAGFGSLALAGLAGVVLLWLAMPETHPVLPPRDKRPTGPLLPRPAAGA